MNATQSSTTTTPKVYARLLWEHHTGLTSGYQWTLRCSDDRLNRMPMGTDRAAAIRMASEMNGRRAVLDLPLIRISTV